MEVCGNCSDNTNNDLKLSVHKVAKCKSSHQSLVVLVTINIVEATGEKNDNGTLCY